jgi:hypothetical protein
MSDKIVKFSVLCHRPYSLDGYDKTGIIYNRIIDCIDNILYDLEKDDKIIIGLTKLGLGIDQTFAKMCFKRNIAYYVYLPYKCQESLWINIPDFNLSDYQSAIENSSKCIQVYDGNYSPKKIIQTQAKIIKDSDYILHIHGFWPIQNEYAKLLSTDKKIFRLNPYV